MGSDLLSKIRNRARVEKGLPVEEEPPAPTPTPARRGASAQPRPDDEQSEDEQPEDEVGREIDDEETGSAEEEEVLVDEIDDDGENYLVLPVADNDLKPVPVRTDYPLVPDVVADVVAGAVAGTVADPRFHSTVTDLVERRVTEFLFDVSASPDNRLVLKLVGSTLAVLKSQWTTYNLSRPQPSRIPFSAYVARRLDYCQSHNSESKHVYLSADDVAALDQLAGENFQTAEQLVNWIRRVVTPISTIESPDGGKISEIRLRPIPSDIYDRFAAGCYPGEDPVERMSEVIDETLRRRVGL